MTEKVKVSREVAEAIELLKNEFNYDFEAFLKVRMGGGWSINKKCIQLNKVSPEDIAKILINGYEIVQTPEEQVVEEYKYWLEILNKYESEILPYTDYGRKQFASGFVSAIAKLSQVYKIKGVNA